MPTPSLFKWRHFLPEIIRLNVRWYCRYALSYRDLEEMMAERGIEVDHATINRWVLKSAPELDKRLRPHLRPTNDLVVGGCHQLEGVYRLTVAPFFRHSGGSAVVKLETL